MPRPASSSPTICRPDSRSFRRRPRKERTRGGTWSVGALDNAGAGATATLTIVATVQQSGAITNTASVTASDQTDPNSTNDSASASLNGNPLADLAIVKTGPASAAPGDTLVYTIVVTNNGPSDAVNVVVDDPMPGGITFVGNAGACTTPYPCALGGAGERRQRRRSRRRRSCRPTTAGAPSIVNIAIGVERYARSGQHEQPGLGRDHDRHASARARILRS